MGQKRAYGASRINATELHQTMQKKLGQEACVLGAQRATGFKKKGRKKAEKSNGFLVLDQGGKAPTAPATHAHTWGTKWRTWALGRGQAGSPQTRLVGAEQTLDTDAIFLTDDQLKMYRSVFTNVFLCPSMTANLVKGQRDLSVYASFIAKTSRAYRRLGKCLQSNTVHLKLLFNSLGEAIGATYRDGLALGHVVQRDDGVRQDGAARGPRLACKASARAG